MLGVKKAGSMLASAFATMASATTAAQDSFRGFGRKVEDYKETRVARTKAYIDRAGQSHGRSGDKLARKAMKGTISLRHGKGPFAGWHLNSYQKAGKP